MKYSFKLFFSSLFFTFLIANVTRAGDCINYTEIINEDPICLKKPDISNVEHILNKKGESLKKIGLKYDLSSKVSESGLSSCTVIPTIYLDSDISARKEDFKTNIIKNLEKSAKEAERKVFVDEVKAKLVSIKWLTPYKITISVDIDAADYFNLHYIRCRHLKCRKAIKRVKWLSLKYRLNRVISVNEKLEYKLDTFSADPINPRVSKSRDFTELRTKYFNSQSTTYERGGRKFKDILRSLLRVFYDSLAGLLVEMPSELLQSTDPDAFNRLDIQSTDIIKGIRKIPIKEQIKEKEMTRVEKNSGGFIDYSSESYLNNFKRDAFFDSLCLVPDKKIFTNKGNNIARTFYKLNILDYKKLVRHFRKTNIGIEQGTTSGEFNHNIFIQKGRTKEILEKWLKEYADDFNQLNTNETFVDLSTQKSMRVVTEKKYGKNLSSLIYQLPDNVAGKHGSNIYRLPSEMSLYENSIVQQGETIESISVYYGLSNVEVQCLEKIALETSGNVDIIKPGTNYSKCMNLVESYKEEFKFLYGDENKFKQLQSKFKDISYKETNEFSAPLEGSINYRGWYYCKYNSCTGNKNVLWNTKISKYQGRTGGSHPALDIWSNSNGSSKVLAIADTNSIDYKYGSKWGETLLIHFKKEGKLYTAVYAHLPKGTRKIKGKKVKSGDFISVTGCSGNSGVPSKYDCNDWCDIEGKIHNPLDQHLHFEIIDSVSCNNGSSKCKRVDPVEFLSLKINDRPKQIRLYSCKAK